jgi:hypothetical protein
MILTASLICLILAFVCFLLAAFGVSARVSWRDLGYACVVLALIFGAVKF